MKPRPPASKTATVRQVTSVRQVTAKSEFFPIADGSYVVRMDATTNGRRHTFGTERTLLVSSGAESIGGVPVKVEAEVGRTIEKWGSVFYRCRVSLESGEDDTGYVCPYQAR